ncbi:MAG TPA: rhamnosidase [Bacteroidetes bacterium]|nr:rhamnosidase [Bacteroidota bacterium]
MVAGEFRGRILGGLVWTLLVTLAFISCGRAPMTFKPTNLRCEYQKDPLGIDVEKPRLSWNLAARGRGVAQTAYRILVATDPQILASDSADIWDSGKVDSDQSAGVVYAGKPLQARTRYFWKVRYWDQNGEISDWSDVAWWEMGLLGPGDWQAQWIAAGEPGKTEQEEKLQGKWIWYPGECGKAKPFYFRKVFDVPDRSQVDTAYVAVTADNRFTLYLNGELIGSGSDWQEVKHYDVHVQLKPGRNVLAIRADNVQGDVCGLICNLHMRLKSGELVEIFTDETWKVADREVPGWLDDPDLDDSGWKNARVVGEAGHSTWSERIASGKYTPPRSQMVRKEIELPKAVSSARLYVTGLGSYRMFINGKRVGKDVLTPGWTDYRVRIQYQTYDVTNLLQKGKNALGAILGNAWWSGELGWTMQAQYSAGPLRLLAQLHVNYDDGTSDVFVTDASWKSHDSPILYNGIYNGETYDARLEMPGWDLPGFDDSAWKPVKVTDDGYDKLVAQQAEPVREEGVLTAKSITEPKPGVFVFDMGQNASGYARLTVRGAQPGTRVQLRFAEVLNPDGTIYTDNYRKAKATDVYICKGNGTEVWQPMFTFRGFRYVEVTGYPGKPNADAVKSVVIHSNMPWIGEFSCSEEVINRVHHNLLWGLRSNLLSIPTDCPQRDERLGWTGDAQIISRTACYNLHMARFFTKWLRDLASSQDEQGAVRDVAPAVVVGENPASPAWGDAIVVVPWVVYEMYGDVRVLEENYEPAKRWYEYMRSHEKDGIFDREGYGDWVAVVPSPKKPIAGAYEFLDATLLSRWAKVLGKEEEAAWFEKEAERLRDAFNRRYLDPSSNWYVGKTQTANVLPLAFGLVPSDRARAVAERVAEDVRKRDFHLSTGFLGTAYLLPVLCDYGFEEEAYRLAVQTTYPSWGYMVERGATTIWELWNSDVEGPGMNSRNHYALGAVDQWFYEYVGGIRPADENAGFKRSVIWPQLTSFLEWASVSHETEYGRLACSWRRRDGKLTLDVTVPPNTTAEVHVPVSDPARARISVDGVAVFAEGEQQGKVAHLRLKGPAGNAVVFEVDAGQYSFTVE